LRTVAASLEAIAKWLVHLVDRVVAHVTGDYAKPAGVSIAHPQWLYNLLLKCGVETAAPLVAGRALDVGCGDKPWQALFTEVDSYIGLDYLGPSATAKAALNVDVCGDATELPFRSGSFDSVIAMEVLEHVKQPEMALSEIKRVLRPDGYLVVTVPFLYRVHDPVHDFWRYTSHGLQTLLHDAGFVKVAVTPIGSLYASMVVALGVHTFYEMASVDPAAGAPGKVCAVLWRIMGRPVCLPAYVVANVIGLALYKIVGPRCWWPPNTMPGNYLATAQKGQKRCYR